MSHSAEAVKAQIKTYVRVFIALAILTVATVAVSYLHLPFIGALLVALAIASLKGTLVAAFFMHLSGEKKIIFWILVLAAGAFLTLMFLPLWSHPA